MMPKPVVSPNILTLDMATATGWAHSNGAGGVVLLPGKEGARLDFFIDWLYEVKAKYPVTIIVYEAGSHKRGGDAMRLGIGLHTCVSLFSYWTGIPSLPLNTKQIKKHATGNGNADKTKMIAAARKKWPKLKHYENNYIDAKWMLDFAETLQAEGKLKRKGSY